MRIESSVTSLSWIPQGATEGFNRLTFRLLASPTRSATSKVLGDLDELGGPDEVRATGRFRLANRLKAWIEVRDGRVVDADQAGCGRIVLPRSATARPASRSPRSPCPTCAPRRQVARNRQHDRPGATSLSVINPAPASHAPNPPFGGVS